MTELSPSVVRLLSAQSVRLWRVRHQHCSVKSNPKVAEDSLSANSDLVRTGAVSLIEMPDGDKILARDNIGNDSRI